MYYRNEVLRYLQSNQILALKLDHAVTGVGKAVAKQIETIGAGAKRALFYASCFTDEYQDVCQQQKMEDLRFRDGVIRLIQHGDVIFDMLKIYFEEIFKYKTHDQIERIKQRLMAANIHIAASYLTGSGFALATAASVSVGLNLSLRISTLAGGTANTALTVAGIYGIVQKAAESANRLRFTLPAYYSALYAHELEMMYFLIEPLFEHAGALDAQQVSDSDIVDIITRMI